MAKLHIRCPNTGRNAFTGFDISGTSSFEVSNCSLQCEHCGDMHVFSNADIVEWIEEAKLSELAPDNFRGDNEHLKRCIKALLELDASGSLVPHGIGGHARGLLTSAYHRLPDNSEPLLDRIERYWALVLLGIIVAGLCAFLVLT